jgi:hypothetical protein
MLAEIAMPYQDFRQSLNYMLPRELGGLYR